MKTEAQGELVRLRDRAAVREYADQESRALLGVSYKDAVEKLSRGELRGTAAEAQIGGLVALLKK